MKTKNQKSLSAATSTKQICFQQCLKCTTNLMMLAACSTELLSTFKRTVKTELFDIAYSEQKINKLEHSALISATMRLWFACDIRHFTNVFLIWYVLSSSATSGLSAAAFNTGPITSGKYCSKSLPMILHIRAQADIMYDIWNVIKTKNRQLPIYYCIT